MTEQLQMSFVPEAHAIKAMRSNGFKSTDTAIAELIDNSIQAGLKHSTKVSLDVICVEETNPSGKGSRITDIYVLDDAGGMHPTLMRRAVQFGQGTNLDVEHQKGMGKFGMGLPNSSISQCKRLEVYSWQTAGDIHKIYMDIDEIELGAQTGVPLTERCMLPEFFQKSKVKQELKFAAAGTLVSWTKLDRATWRTHVGVFNNAEYLIGRMYRHFLNDGRAKIRFIAFKRLASGDYEKLKEKFVRPNDPLFLMSNTSAPAPYDRQPAFVEQTTQRVSVTVDGETHIVTVRASHRGHEVLNEATNTGKTPGDLPIGKFVRNCTGVSIVRAGRELCLSQDWTIAYDPTERWWGIEISFEPALDEILGVSNDKQQAANIRALSIADIAADNNISKAEARTALIGELESGDPTMSVILDISQAVENALSPIRKTVTKQRVGIKKKREAEPAVKKGTDHINQNGDPGQTQIWNDTPPSQRQDATKKLLVADGETPEAAAIRVTAIEENKSRVEFVMTDLGNRDLFESTLQNGFYYIRVNSGHPAIQKLAGIDSQTEDQDLDNETLNRLKLFFLTWVDMEAKANPEEKKNIRDVRQTWGFESWRMFNK